MKVCQTFISTCKCVCNVRTVILYMCLLLQEDGENNIMGGLMICFHQYYLGDQMKDNKTEGARGTHWGGDKFIRDFNGET